MDRALKDAIIETYRNIYGSGIYESVKECLDLGPDSSYFGSVWSLISVVYTALEIIGILLCLIWFFQTLIEQSSRQEFTFETFGKECIMMIFCCVIINLGLDFVTGVADFSTELLTTIKNAITGEGVVTGSNPDGTTLLEAMIAEVEAYTTMETIAHYLNTFMFNIIVSLEKILIIVAALSRSVEFILYSMFFPWGVSDLYKNGTSSKGMTYIKKLAALGVQGSVIYLIVTIANAISASVTLGDATNGPIYSIAIMTVSVMLTFGSIKYSNDFMGV